MISLQSLIATGILSSIYSLMGMGVWLTQTGVKRYDLSLEGSFCLGGAFTALLLYQGMPALISLPIAFLVGMLVGSCTGMLSVYLNLDALLCGIIINTAIFSLALLTAGSHLSLSNTSSLIVTLQQQGNGWIVLLAMLALAAILVWIVKWFLTTQIGLLFRAAGENPSLVQELGKSVSAYHIGTYMMANGLSALAGNLFVQYIGFFYVWGSIGSLIIALTGTLFAQIINPSLGFNIIVGSFCYQMIIALTLQLDVQPEFTKIITAFLTIILMATLTRNKRS